MSHRFFLFLLLLACLLASHSAEAVVENVLVKSGISAFKALDYPRAIELLTKARQQTLTREESIAAHYTLSLCHAATGDEVAARKDFEVLLRQQPSFTLGRNVAPHIRALFEQAKTAIATGARADESVAQRELHAVVSPSSPTEGDALDVRMVDLPAGATKASLLYRPSGADRFSAVEAAVVAGAVETKVPPGAVRAPFLEYYVSALDAQGAPLGSAGSLEHPLRVDVTRKKIPVYKRAWLWGLVGGLAVGAGLGVGLGVGLTRPATLTVQAH